MCVPLLLWHSAPVLRRMGRPAPSWPAPAAPIHCHRLAVGREEAVQALAADPSHAGGVAAVEAKGNFIFDTATHRDFLGGCAIRHTRARAAWRGWHAGLPRAMHAPLQPAARHAQPTSLLSAPPNPNLPNLTRLAGACLGTGVDRSRVGDIIIVGEQGAQILCTPNLAEHLEGALTQAGAGLQRLGLGLGPLLAQPVVGSSRRVRLVWSVGRGASPLQPTCVPALGLRCNRRSAACRCRRGPSACLSCR